MEQPLGIIGLGLVGTALSQRLLAAGYRLDIAAERCAAFAAAGGQATTTVVDVASACSMIFLSLPDSAAVASVVGPLRTAATPPRYIIDTTTGDPAQVEPLATALAAAGIDYLDAAISGSSDQVRTGAAVFMVGGDSDAFSRCAPLLADLSDTVFHLGPAGSGSRAKLASNLVLGLNRLALAEGLVLAEALGLDTARFLDLLMQTPAYSRQMDTKGPKMVQGDFAPAARLAQHRKDVGLILAAAHRAGLELPVSALHAQLLDAAIDAGDGALDNSAIIRQVRRTGSGVQTS